MNIFRQYTLKSLWKNKSRTAVTIIGIILSVAMFTAVTTTVSSIYNFLLESAVSNDGCWHINIAGIDDGQIREAASGDDIEQKAFLWNVSYARLDTIKRESSPYLYIGGYDGDFPELLSVQMVEGRLPNNSSELIIPEGMAELSGISWKPGDSVSLETGIRKEKKSGEVLWQDCSYENKEETFTSSGEKSYHIVGTYRSADFGSWGYDLDTPGYTALTKKEDSVTANLHMAYMTLKSPEDTGNVMARWEKKYGGNAMVSTNSYYLKLKGAYLSESLGKMLLGLMMILIGIIMFGSIALIYNAFSISVNERKKQYGLLSSIGATRKQLRKSVVFEAAVVSLIGIPLGVLAGIGGMSVTFYCLRDKFSIFLNASDDKGITLHMSAALWAVALAAGIGFITVLISAYLPARKALKLNAIEAIRQNTDIVMNPKKLKTSRLTLRLFGLEGMLASKNYKRNKRKYRATVFSLFISVVLFISASSFCDYLNKSMSDILYNYDCDLRFSISGMMPGKDTEKLYQKLQHAADVTSYTSHYIFWETEARMPGKYLTELFYLNETGEQKPTEEKKLEKMAAIRNMKIVFVEDNLFEEYLKNNRLDASLYMNPDKPAAVLYDKGKFYNSEKERYQITHAFTEKPEPFSLCFLKRNNDIEEYDDNGTTQVTAEEPEKLGETAITIGEFCESTPEGVDQERDYAPLLLYPYCAMDTICPPDVQKQLSSNGIEYVVTLNSNKPDKTYESVNTILSDFTSNLDSGGSYNLYNVAEEIKNSRALMTILNIFSYGFILLISLIAMANVFNTISTNVYLRRREFAMLRSVGMTQKSFHKMSCFECLLYGVKGLMYGLPAAIGITALIWYAVSAEIEISFYIPWYSIVIAIGSVFAVVFATMLYSTGKIRKENVIDTLKEENY